MASLIEIMQLCRLCLVKDQVNIPIFEEQGDVRQIFLKLAACFPTVQVSRDDNLPKKICESCMFKLEHSYQFWSLTTNAEKQLNVWLKQIGLDANSKVVGQQSLQMVAQSHAHPHSLETETVILKQEAIDPIDVRPDIGVSSDTQSYILQQQQLPYQPVGFQYEQPPAFSQPSTSSNTGPSATVTSATNEPAMLGKRKRRQVITNPIPSSEESDDDEDIQPPKIAKEEEDSDSADDNEPLQPTAFVSVPAISQDAEQPGPSGLNKPTAGSTSEAPYLRPTVSNRKVGLHGQLHVIRDYVENAKSMLKKKLNTASKSILNNHGAPPGKDNIFNTLKTSNPSVIKSVDNDRQTVDHNEIRPLSKTTPVNVITLCDKEAILTSHLKQFDDSNITVPTLKVALQSADNILEPTFSEKHNIETWANHNSTVNFTKEPDLSIPEVSSKTISFERRNLCFVVNETKKLKTPDATVVRANELNTPTAKVASKSSEAKTKTNSIPRQSEETVTPMHTILDTSNSSTLTPNVDTVISDAQLNAKSCVNETDHSNDQLANKTSSSINIISNLLITSSVPGCSLTTTNHCTPNVVNSPSITTNVNESTNPSTYIFQLERAHTNWQVIMPKLNFKDPLYRNTIKGHILKKLEYVIAKEELKISYNLTKLMQKDFTTKSLYAVPSVAHAMKQTKLIGESSNYPPVINNISTNVWVDHSYALNRNAKAASCQLEAEENFISELDSLAEECKLRTLSCSSGSIDPNQSAKSCVKKKKFVTKILKITRNISLVNLKKTRIADRTNLFQTKLILPVTTCTGSLAMQKKK